MKKQTLYTVTGAGWMLLVMGATVAIYSGQAEALVSTSQIPRGPLVMFGGAAGAIVIGWSVISYHQDRSWRAMGPQADLAPDGGSLLPFGKPDLAGEVDGRPVRARILKRKKSDGTEGSSGKSTSTVVEADLEEPADAGVIIARTDPGASSAERVEVGSTSITTETVDDRFAIAADSADLGRAVLTMRVHDALLAVDTVDVLLVGNASDTLMDSVPDGSGSILGGFVGDAVKAVLAGDESTVAHEIDHVVLDPDELERQVQAVAAVADAFEDATAEDGWG